jgi:hypothetical protein
VHLLPDVARLLCRRLAAIMVGGIARRRAACLRST